MSHARSPLARLFGLFRRRKPEPSTASPDGESLQPSLNAPSDLADETRYNAYELVTAKFQIGQVVKHRFFPFRGVIFDVDPEFANSEEWYEAIPEDVRPAREQPYYHLFAENEKTHYLAYVSEQNLEICDDDTPVRHPDISDLFDLDTDGTYNLKPGAAN